MYLTLDPQSLGIRANQSEMIEFAMTHNFAAIDLDMPDLLKRAQKKDVDYACRFLKSAPLAGGVFDLPIQISADEASFRSQLVDLEQVCEIAQTLDTRRGRLILESGSNELPYHENFEMHRQRLQLLADKLAESKMQVGLGFTALTSPEESQAFAFVRDVAGLLALIESVNRPQIGVWLDTAQWIAGSGTTEDLSKLKADQIVGVQLVDIPAETNLEAADPSSLCLPNALGQVPIGEFVSALEAISYSGPISLGGVTEMVSPAQRDQQVRQAYDRLQQYLRPETVDLAESAVDSTQAESTSESLGNDSSDAAAS